MKPAGKLRPWRALLAAIAAAVAVAAFWHQGVRYNVTPRNFGVVEPGKIYRSGKLTPAAMRRVHEQYGIRTIVDLGAYEPGSLEDQRWQRVADSLRVPRYRFGLIGDATGNPNAYVQALRLLTDPSLHPVLLHCGAGSERTSCAVILYRHVVQGADIIEAFDESKRYKHNPARNEGVFRMLLAWGPAIERAFREGGQIPGVEPLPTPAPVGSAAGAEPMRDAEVATHAGMDG